MPPPSLRLTYISHTQRSDWNNGNAHFLRGLLRSLGKLGHTLNLLEPEHEWSIDNLRSEPRGAASLTQFAEVYPDLPIRTYPANTFDRDTWLPLLAGQQVVILHEWNPPALASLLLDLRAELGYKLLFHDTHHRASSSPESFRTLRLHEFDGVLAFGEVLREIYRTRFGMDRVWTLHEAADTSVFHPISLPRTGEDRSGPEVVWIGNWGDNERSAEIRDFFLAPAAALPEHTFQIFGVRYPEDGLAALAAAGVKYGGYLPNLDAPATYARARLTVHIPRQQYSTVMRGIPTIRVFEALACGIPLLSAPWEDTEQLFRPGDLRLAHTTAEMTAAMRELLEDPAAAQAFADRGRHTVFARHTCDHRAAELTAICNSLLHIPGPQETQPA